MASFWLALHAVLVANPSQRVHAEAFATGKLGKAGKILWHKVGANNAIASNTEVRRKLRVLANQREASVDAVREELVHWLIAVAAHTAADSDEHLFVDDTAHHGGSCLNPSIGHDH
jgi:hypothetical protein